MLLDIYTRVSVVGKREGENFISPASQRETVEAYATMHGHTVGRVFEELDESGGRADRPLLLEAIARQESGEAQVLAVARLDRFGRSLIDGLAAIKRVTDAGGSFVSVADDLNFSTPTGKLVLSLMLSLGEYELDRVRATWADAQQRAVARGVFLGSVPLGYRRTQSGRLLIDEGTAPLARELFARRLRGETPTQLARWLSGQGAPTFRGGSRWSANTVRSVISRRAYLGESSHGRFVNATAHPALVDPPTWQAAQIPRGGGSGPRRKLPALLRGLLRCSGCGRLLTTRTDENQRLLYQCQGVSTAGTCPAPVTVFDAVVEPYAEAVLWGLLTGGGPRRQQAAVSKAEAAVAACTAQLSRYRDHPTLPGTLGPERYSAGLTVRLAREEKALLQLAKTRASAEAAAPGLAETRARWPHMTIDQRRQLLSSQLDCLFVLPRNQVPRLWAFARGSQPTGLPAQAPRRMTDPCPFYPAASHPRALPAKSSLDWSKPKVTRTLGAFLQGREAWPDFADFQAAGLGLAHANAARHMATVCWADHFGVARPRSKPDAGGWSEDRVRDELAVALAGWDHWPTCADFAAINNRHLRSAVRLHGGASRWADEMGLPMGKRQRRTRQRWTRQAMLEAVAEMTAGQDHWPDKKQFAAADLTGLYETVGRAGARDQLADELGLSVSCRGSRYYRRPVRWDQATIDSALRELLEGQARYPTFVQFAEQGLGGLHQTVGRQPGGHDAVAKRFELPRGRPAKAKVGSRAPIDREELPRASVR